MKKHLPNTKRLHHVGSAAGIFMNTFLVCRLSTLAQDMANVQVRVDNVNKAVKQLEDSRHPRTKEIKGCQERLNKRCFYCFSCSWKKIFVLLFFILF